MLRQPTVCSLLQRKWFLVDYDKVSWGKGEEELILIMKGRDLRTSLNIMLLLDAISRPSASAKGRFGQREVRDPISSRSLQT